MSKQQEESSIGGSWMVFMIPLALISFVSITAAFIAAKVGAGRAVVRLFLLPLNFLVANFVGLLLFGAGSFTIAIFTGKMVYERFTDHLDVTLFNVWGRFIGWVFRFDVPPEAYAIGIPIWHVILFQIILWILIGNRLASFTTNITMAASGRE